MRWAAFQPVRVSMLSVVAGRSARDRAYAQHRVCCTAVRFARAHGAAASRGPALSQGLGVGRGTYAGHSYSHVRAQKEYL